MPATPPPSPASACASSVATGQQDEQRRRSPARRAGRRRPRGPCAARARRASPKRRAARAPRRCRRSPRSARRRRRRAASRASRRPGTRPAAPTSRAGARAGCRRSRPPPAPRPRSPCCRRRTAWSTGRHQSPSSGPASTRSSDPVPAGAADQRHDDRGEDSAIVAYGRRSGLMPGISPRRSGASRGRARRGGFGVPPRSSFGARLRSRVPQYGHSVMYGDTSEPQLLQTTKRSGPLAIGDRFYAPGDDAQPPVGVILLARRTRLEENPIPWHSATTESCTSWPSTIAVRSRRRCSGSRAIPPPRRPRRSPTPSG